MFLLLLLVVIATGVMGFLVYRILNVRLILAVVVAGVLFRLSLLGSVLGLIISVAVLAAIIVGMRRPLGPFGLVIDGWEMIPTTLIAAPFCVILGRALMVISSKWWMVAIMVTLLVVVIMELLVSFFHNRGRVLNRGIAIILIVLIWVFGFFRADGVKPFFEKTGQKLTAWTQIDETKAKKTKAGKTGVETSWYAFYNLSMSKDNKTENDFNFGYDLAEFVKNPTVSDYDANFRERIKKDPALGAADMAWFDAILGTRYLGTFYEECKGEWASTINSAKDYWCDDHQLEYFQTLDAFFEFLDSGTVSIERGSGVTDQMYMNPLTPNSIPDVIVMKTNQNDGLFLVYTFMIKGNEFKVRYRTECGYQPTNVEEVMGIIPQDKPTPTPTPTDPPKDKTKGTQGELVKPNDDSGPGPNTNNGVGARQSAVDRDDTSTSYESYNEYRAEVEGLEEINEEQQTGSDNNQPTTPAKPGTNVDNNGNEGTGSGGINIPTPIELPAKEAETGENIDSKPGEAWGGPPD